MKTWSMKAKLHVVSLAVLGIVGLSFGATGVVSAATKSLPPSPTYVALGDSIAAGAGLPIGPAADDAVCARSPQAYPTLLATKINTTVTNLACSGAKDSDGIINGQITQGVTVPSQLDRAFQNGVPNLITITIGANDVRWVQFIGKCYVDTCGGVGDTAAAAGYLTYFQGKLAYTLREIKERSGSQTPPKVLISGYYNPVTSTSCLGGQVTNAELRWINAQTDNLNKSIRQTVAATSKISSWFKGTYNFASYVPVSFSGHGICSQSPWVQNLTDPAPLHPNSQGAAQIANTLYNYVK